MINKIKPRRSFLVATVQSLIGAAARYKLLLLRLTGLGLNLILVTYVVSVVGLATLGHYAPYLAASVFLASAAAAAASRRLSVQSLTNKITADQAGHEAFLASLSALLGSVVIGTALIMALGPDPWVLLLFVSSATAANQLFCRGLNFAHYPNAGLGMERILTPGLSLLIALVGGQLIDKSLALGVALMAGPWLTTLYLLTVTKRLCPNSRDSRPMGIDRHPRTDAGSVHVTAATIFDAALIPGLLFAAKFMMEPTQVGIISLSLTLAASLAVVHLAITMPWVAQISDARRSLDRAGAHRALRKSQVMSGAISLSFVAVLLTGAVVVDVLLPNRHISLWPLSLICAGYIFRSLSGASFFVLEGSANTLRLAASQAIPITAFSAMSALTLLSDRRLIMLSAAFAISMAIRTGLLNYFAHRVS